MLHDDNDKGNVQKRIRDLQKMLRSCISLRTEALKKQLIEDHFEEGDR